MSKKIYVSAPFELQASARIVRDLLISHGFTVTSTWLEETPDTQETKQQMAERDERDILSADALLLINPDDWSYKGTGGRHVEVGIARQVRLPVFIYGVRSNVFHHLSNVAAVAPTISPLLSSLKEWRDRS